MTIVLKAFINCNIYRKTLFGCIRNEIDAGVAHLGDVKVLQADGPYGHSSSLFSLPNFLISARPLVSGGVLLAPVTHDIRLCSTTIHTRAILTINANRYLCIETSCHVCVVCHHVFVLTIIKYDYMT